MPNCIATSGLVTRALRGTVVAGATAVIITTTTTTGTGTTGGAGCGGETV